MPVWFGKTVVRVLMGLCASSVHAQTGSQAYSLSAEVHRVPAGCGDRYSARDQVYGRIRVVEPELEARISTTKKRIRQIVGKSPAFAQSVLDNLAQREFQSEVAPLSEAERQRLEDLREAKRAHRRKRAQAFQRREKDWMKLRHFPEQKELNGLAARIPLSALELGVLRRGQELMDRLKGLESQRRVMRTPGSVRVYANEKLNIGIWEDDLLFDDRCFTTSVTLDRSTLERGFLEIGKAAARGDGAERPPLMTLHFTAFP